MLVALAAVAALLPPELAPGQEGAPATEVSRSRRVSVVADTYVVAAKPNEVFGSSPIMIVDAQPRRQAYIRFDVPDVRARIRKATLRLHVADRPGAGSTSGGAVAGTTDTTWTEATTTWANRPAIDRSSIGRIGQVRRGRWASKDVTSLVRDNETVTFVVTPTSSDDAVYDARGSGFGPRLRLELDASPLGGTVVAAVGDMVCGAGAPTTPTECHEEQVSDLVADDPRVEHFLALGDLQYNSGSLADFQSEYEPTYGRFKDLTHPVPGNHKYQTPNAEGYWDYFGAQAGTRYEGWYSFDVGSAWHLVALNSNCSQVDCGRDSPQVEWLRQDLAANDRPCILGYFHHPRWASAMTPPRTAGVKPFLRVLQRHGADVVLAGHAHTYERFARLRPNQTVAPDGMRHFVVGTGGRSLGTFGTIQPHSQRRLSTFGVLKLTLTDNSFWWGFEDETGQVLDSGQDRCR